jgi:glycosyltransferase involved in cell wall biosynthesis
LGARTDIPQILAAADAAILPSMAEGLPNAVLEYLAAGKPTIATSVGGIPEIIQHEKNGLLIPPGSPEALQSAIIRILSNPSEAAEFARAGRADMREKFSFERLVQELENLYGIK